MLFEGRCWAQPVTSGPGAPIEALTELHLEPKGSLHEAETDNGNNSPLLWNCEGFSLQPLCSNTSKEPLGHREHVFVVESLYLKSKMASLSCNDVATLFVNSGSCRPYRLFDMQLRENVHRFLTWRAGCPRTFCYMLQRYCFDSN